MDKPAVSIIGGMCFAALVHITHQWDHVRSHPFVPPTAAPTPSGPATTAATALLAQAQQAAEQQRAANERRCSTDTRCACQTREILLHADPAAVRGVLATSDFATRRTRLDALFQQTFVRHRVVIDQLCPAAHGTPT